MLYHFGPLEMYEVPDDEQPPDAVSTGYQSTMTMSAIFVVYGFELSPKWGMLPNRATTGCAVSAALTALYSDRISVAEMPVPPGSLTVR